MQDFSGVDNYVDDVFIVTVESDAVAVELAHYGLPTKPGQPLATARVLGLQISEGEDGKLRWSRREMELSPPNRLTRRAVFQWCGRLVSHYPICGWLRPCCSWLKRMIDPDCGWDEAVPDDVVR